MLSSVQPLAWQSSPAGSYFSRKREKAPAWREDSFLRVRVAAFVPGGGSMLSVWPSGHNSMRHHLSTVSVLSVLFLFVWTSLKLKGIQCMYILTGTIIRSYWLPIKCFLLQIPPRSWRTSCRSSMEMAWWPDITRRRFRFLFPWVGTLLR